MRSMRLLVHLPIALAVVMTAGCSRRANDPGPSELRFRSGLSSAAQWPTDDSEDSEDAASSDASETAEEAPSVLATLLRTTPRAGAIDPEERFDVDRAMSDARDLAAFGSRPGGSEAEHMAAAYVERRLRALGYEPTVQTFDLPNGKVSSNVIASLDGYASSRTVILGAHIDTKPPSPGANDNASGAGVVLELARLLRDNPPAGRTLFVFYGTEEFLVDAPGDNHHLGSRFHAASMTQKERDATAAMISVDMVGYGSRFLVRTMRRGPLTLSDLMLAYARRNQVGLFYERDPGETGWSDHEPYERAGMPVAWLEWQSDPTYHTEGDTGDHLQRRPFDVTGSFLLRFIRGLDHEDLERLCER